MLPGFLSPVGFSSPASFGLAAFIADPGFIFPSNGLAIVHDRTVLSSAIKAGRRFEAQPQNH
jgi:hypothetical protein